METCLFTKSTHSPLRPHRLRPPFPTWQSFRQRTFIFLPVFSSREMMPFQASRDLLRGPHQPGYLLQTLFFHLKILVQQSSCNTTAQLSCWAETLSKNSGNLLWSRLPNPQNPDLNLSLSSPRTCSNHPLAGHHPSVPRMNHEFLSLLLLAASPGQWLMVDGTDTTPSDALCPECGNLRVKAALNTPSQEPSDYPHLTESEMRPGRSWAPFSGFLVRGHL